MLALLWDAACGISENVSATFPQKSADDHWLVRIVQDNYGITDYRYLNKICTGIPKIIVSTRFIVLYKFAVHFWTDRFYV